MYIPLEERGNAKKYTGVHMIFEFACGDIRRKARIAFASGPAAPA
jgi:hypothetical protein